LKKSLHVIEDLDWMGMKLWRSFWGEGNVLPQVVKICPCDEKKAVAYLEPSMPFREGRLPLHSKDRLGYCSKAIP